MKAHDLKMLIRCLSDDPTKSYLQYAYFDGEYGWATNGHVLYRCNYKHSHERFLMDKKGLQQGIRATKKGKDVNMADLPTKAIDGVPVPQYSLLIPSRGMVCKFVANKTLELASTVREHSHMIASLRFCGDVLSVNHGVNGRWLDGETGVIATADSYWCSHATAKNPVPIINYSPSNHPPDYYPWDELKIVSNQQPILFCNSVLGSIFLTMPIACRNDSTGFDD